MHRLQVSPKDSSATKRKEDAEEKSQIVYADIAKRKEKKKQSNDDYHQLSDDDVNSQTDSQSTMASDSRSITSTMSSGISDAGFLYKRLKVCIFVYQHSYSSYCPQKTKSVMWAFIRLGARSFGDFNKCQISLMMVFLWC